MMQRKVRCWCLFTAPHRRAQAASAICKKLPTTTGNALGNKFGERIYAFEHRTFSESPIENAIELAAKLPKGAQINLVTHSRGGLVGDLLCLEKFSDELDRKL